MRAYEYRHTVSFEETNLLGNVYYVNHLRWQGRCREMFLKEHAPGVLRELEANLALVTLHCSCDYLGELAAFDEITIRMTVGSLTRNRLSMIFEYWKGASLVARGEQSIACMRREPGGLSAAPFPAELQEALANFSER